VTEYFILQAVLKQMPTGVAVWGSLVPAFEHTGIPLEQLGQSAPAKRPEAVKTLGQTVILHFRNGKILFEALGEIGETVIQIQAVIGQAGINGFEQRLFFELRQGAGLLGSYQLIEKRNDIRPLVEKGGKQEFAHRGVFRWRQRPEYLK
jgi:hypothetical protein